MRLVGAFIVFATWLIFTFFAVTLGDLLAVSIGIYFEWSIHAFKWVWLCEFCVWLGLTRLTFITIGRLCEMAFPIQGDRDDRNIDDAEEL